MEKMVIMIQLCCQKVLLFWADHNNLITKMGLKPLKTNDGRRPEDNLLWENLQRLISEPHRPGDPQERRENRTHLGWNSRKQPRREERAYG